MFEGWAAAAAVGTVAAAGISASAAGSAADKQANAAANAQNISEQQFNTINQQEMPYMNAGNQAIQALNQGLGTGTDNGSGGYGSLTAPFTMNDFKNLSPAYQFQLQQGQQGVLNQDSTGQGALSGATMKDLIGYNQNLAGTSFNNAFNQYQQQQQNVYSRLSGVAQLGQNAASNTGQQGTALAGQAAQSATNIGTAQAAGAIGQGNAYAGAANNLGSLAYLFSGNQSPSSSGTLSSSDWVNQLYGGG